MKNLLKLITLFATLLPLTACSLIPNDSNTIEQQSDITHVNIDLNNYDYYLTVINNSSSNTHWTQYRLEFTGALTFATYNNIELSYNKYDTSKEVNTDTLKLDIGGHGITMWSIYNPIEVTNISGYVEYRI